MTEDLTDEDEIEKAKKDTKALELLSNLKTGADPVTDQMVAWHYPDDEDPDTGSYPTAGAEITITEAQGKAANEIISQIDKHVDDGKKVEDLNQIVVALDDKPLGDDENNNGIIETNTKEVT